MFTTRNNLVVVGATFLFTILSLVSLTIGCSCKISERDSPHCGSDGKIYHSMCHLNCERLIKPKMHVKKMASCLHVSSCRWRCLKTHYPVCGSDGKTYRNECFFKCNQNKHPNLKIVKQGRCFKGRRKGNKRDVKSI